VRTQLYIALDVGLITKTQFESLYKMATEASSLIGGFMRYLSNKGATKK
jgi:hypothetical protein